MKKNIIVVAIIIGIILLFNTIYIRNLNHKWQQKLKENECTQVIVEEKNDIEYDSDTNYYKKITAKEFNEVIITDEKKIVAIIDNANKETKEFLKYINQLAFVNQQVYLYDLSKLNKEELVAFYELDENLKKYSNNYIVSFQDGEVISILNYHNYLPKEEEE